MGTFNTGMFAHNLKMLTLSNLRQKIFLIIMLQWSGQSIRPIGSFACLFLRENKCKKLNFVEGICQLCTQEANLFILLWSVTEVLCYFVSVLMMPFSAFWWPGSDLLLVWFTIVWLLLVIEFGLSSTCKSRTSSKIAYVRNKYKIGGCAVSCFSALCMFAVCNSCNSWTYYIYNLSKAAWYKTAKIKALLLITVKTLKKCLNVFSFSRSSGYLLHMSNVYYVIGHTTYLYCFRVLLSCIVLCTV